MPTVESYISTSLDKVGSSYLEEHAHMEDHIQTLGIGSEETLG